MAKQIHMEYETVDCIKCGGTGFIERFADYAQGVCFMCKGSKRSPANPKARAIMKAFNEAKRKVSEMKMVSFSDLKVGDTVKMLNMGAARWEKITEIKETSGIFKLVMVDGVETKVPTPSIVTNGGKNHLAADSDYKMEIAWPIEKKFEAIKENLPEKYRHLLSIIEK